MGAGRGTDTGAGTGMVTGAGRAKAGAGRRKAGAGTTYGADGTGACEGFKLYFAGFLPCGRLCLMPLSRLPPYDWTARFGGRTNFAASVTAISPTHHNGKLNI